MNDKRKAQKMMFVAIARLLFWCVIVVAGLIMFMLDSALAMAAGKLFGVAICVYLFFEFIIKYSNKHWR